MCFLKQVHFFQHIFGFFLIHQYPSSDCLIHGQKLLEFEVLDREELYGSGDCELIVLKAKKTARQPLNT